jgi:hypothetical protein
MKFSRVLVGAILISLSASIVVNAQDAASIQQKLIAKYPLTKATADRTDIVTAGAVLVLEKDNLLMYTTTTTIPPVNTYKNGKLSQGIFSSTKKCAFCAMVPGLSSVAANQPNVDQRTFVAGEKFWVTGIEAHDDGIVFDLLSDPYNDVRYYSQLKFPFPKGSVPAADSFMNTVAEVLKVQPSDDSNGSGNEGKQSQAGGPAPAQPASAAAAPAAAQSSMAPIPPPPPPADAPPPAPKTIEKGQTKDVVVAILGQPSKVIKLGSKEIDVYPDMKITFVNNKVSDVE